MRGTQSKPIGSIIGATAGLAFVLVNAGATPASLVLRAAAIVAFFAIIWFVVLRGPAVDHARPNRQGITVYALSVAVMILAIPAGAAVLRQVVDEPDAVPIWVIFVVGAHFWPFARAFRLPVFAWLSLSLIVVSLLGAIATARTSTATASGWSGVAAGFVLLFFAAIGPRQPTP